MTPEMSALRELVRAKRDRHRNSPDGPDHNTLHPARATWPDGTPCTWCRAWIRAQEIVDSMAGVGESVRGEGAQQKAGDKRNGI